MSKKADRRISKVPTLLELAETLENRPKPPTLLDPSSDDSDLDQPPIAGTKTEIKKLTFTLDPVVKPSPNTRRRSFQLFRNGKTFEESIESGTKFQLSSNDESTGPLIRSSTTKRLASKMERTKRYATFRAREEARLRLPKIISPLSSSNYQIKDIRRGIPKIVRASHEASSVSEAPKLEPTSYFICQPKNVNRKNPLVWLFSLITVMLCFVFPLASFATDIAFFIECSDHYNETKSLIEQAHQKLASLSVTTYANTFENITTEQIQIIHESNFSLNNEENDTQRSLIFDLRIPDLLKGSISSDHENSVDSKLPANVLQGKSLNLGSGTPETTTTEHPEHNGIIETVISSHCYAQFHVPVCDTVPNLLVYMTSKDASRKFQEHKRVTSDVFEPVFILGTFPCLVLSIFTRLVIMITNHDHFVSAYVVNMLCMPLQLVTGALAVHSASYHVGKRGFRCWNCAIEGNCSTVDALSFMEDHLTDNLIATTVAKFFDGVAGGCVLFLVLARKIWVKDGHVSCWWYFFRVCVSFFALAFCVLVCTTMVLTPSLGVFRLEMMEKTAYFQGKKAYCYGSMVLLAMGLTAWGISLLLLFLFLCFQTYVYCRRKEHIAPDPYD